MTENLIPKDGERPQENHVDPMMVSEEAGIAAEAATREEDVSAEADAQEGRDPGEKLGQCLNEDDAATVECEKHQPDDAEGSESSGAIDNFGDVAAFASEASAKAAETAKNAADQVTQTAISAYNRTAEAAKKAKSAAMIAGAQAAAKAEQNQAKATSEEDVPVPQSSRELVSQAWLEYFANHKASVIYGIVGFVAGLCILWVGFVPVLLVLATTYLGLSYGRYRDGDAKIVNFLKDHFSDED